MNPKDIRQLETELEAAIRRVIETSPISLCGHIDRHPNRDRLFHLMAKAAVTVAETVHESQR